MLDFINFGDYFSIKIQTQSLDKPFLIYKNDQLYTDLELNLIDIGSSIEH